MQLLKAKFVVRSLLLVVFCLASLLACKSPPAEVAEDSPSKHDVIQALTTAGGNEVAASYFREWLKEYEIKSEAEIGSEICLEILEQINRGNLSPTILRQRVQATRERLRSATDQHGRLSAFRDVMRTRKIYKNDQGWEHFDSPEEKREATFISGVDTNLPMELLKLQAEVFICENEKVTAVVQPGFKNMGLVAYAAGDNTTPKGAGLKHEKLIEGLWYFEAIEK